MGLLTFGGGGGWVGVMQNRDSPDFRSPEVSISVSIISLRRFRCHLYEDLKSGPEFRTCTVQPDDIHYPLKGAMSRFLLSFKR